MRHEFVRNAYHAYNNISFLETIFSSLLFLAFKLIVLFFCAMVAVLTVGILGGLRGGGFLFLFFIVVLAVLFFSVRSYQKFHKRSPVRRKVFAYRIAQLVEYLAARIDNVEAKKNQVFVQLTDTQNPVKVCYGINLLINAGGVVGGSALTVPKGLHPETFFFTLNGMCRLFENETGNFKFSARSNDEAPVKYRISQYRLKKRFLFLNEHFQTTSTSQPAKHFMDKLKNAVEGTGLNGEIEFDHGRFQLKIFDTVRKITTDRGKIVYRHYQVHDDMKQRKIQDSKTAFYGIERILQLIQVL